MNDVSGWQEVGAGISGESLESASRPQAATQSNFKRSLPSLLEIPDSILRAELARRDNNGDPDDRPSCGSSQRGAYNTTAHVMALFLILVLSTLACSFPVLARRFPRLPIPRRFLFLSRHFGTGVLIATAFVHLLPTAFVSLTDPCLPRFWSESYRAMAGFVAMISVFLVVCVEMIFALKGAGHVHGSEYDHLIGDIGYGSNESDNGAVQGSNYFRVDGQGAVDNIHLEGMRRNVDEGIPRQTSNSRGSTDEPSRAHWKNMDSDKEDDDDDDDDLELLDPFADNDSEANGYQAQPSRSRSQHQRPYSQPRPPNQGSAMQTPQRQLLQCLLLEAGILFHSVFIGMAVSVATGTSFVVLLIAISFHQTFEGFALGSRIASLIPDLFAPSSAKPWLMSLAYGTTTPIGQALGLILRNLYDPASAAGLLMVGITNAISSGLLLFAGLVELLAEDFLSESSYQTLRGRRRIEACLAVAGGALLMAFVGAFA